MESVDPGSALLFLGISPEKTSSHLSTALKLSLESAESPILIRLPEALGHLASAADRKVEFKIAEQAWQLTSIAVSDETNTRRVVVSPRSEEDTWSRVFASILRNPLYSLRVSVRPSPLGVDAIRGLLKERDPQGVPIKTVTQVVAERDVPFEVEFLLIGPRHGLPVDLQAAVRGLALGWQVLPVDINSSLLRRHLTDGTVLRDELPKAFWDEVVDILPVPVPTGALFPGLTVWPTQMRAASHRMGDRTQSTLILGAGIDLAGKKLNITIRQDDLARHMYVPGQTGSGKSTFLRGLAVEVAKSGEGLLFIDPHGDTVDRLLGELPKSRADDICFIDASDVARPATMNPFAVSNPLQRDTAMENVTEMFYDLFDPEGQGIVGPRWETWFRMGMTTLIEAFGSRATILDVPALFIDEKFLRFCLSRLDSDIVRDFWMKEMAQTDSFHKSEVLGWFSSKFTAFRMNSVLDAVLGTGTDVLNPTEVMDASKIVLVSLPKGAIGAPVTQILGYLYLTRFWTSALSRTSGRPFTVFVDEAHSFSRGSLPAMLSEGRKFGIRVVLANQYLAQLPKNLSEAIHGNVGNVVGLRLGADDAGTLQGRFGAEFSKGELAALPNFVAAMSLLIDGSPMPAFSCIVDHEARTLVSANERARQTRHIKASSAENLKAAVEKAVQGVRRAKDQIPVDSDAPEATREPSFMTRWKAERGLTD